MPKNQTAVDAFNSTIPQQGDQTEYLVELVGFLLRYLDQEGPVDVEVFRKACEHAAKQVEGH